MAAQRAPIIWLLALAAILASGCSNNGTERFGLSGTVSIEGEPIKFGWMVFSPEKGPGATANIEEGNFATPEDFGTIGGMHTIELVAFDGIAIPDPTAEGGMNTQGKLVLSHKFKKDIPKETTTLDINITKEDLKKSRQ